jgi:hypothetical protein
LEIMDTTDLEANPEETEAAAETIGAPKEWLGTSERPWDAGTHWIGEPKTMLYAEPLKDGRSRIDVWRCRNATVAQGTWGWTSSCDWEAKEMLMRPSGRLSDWRSRSEQLSFSSHCGKWATGQCGGLGPHPKGRTAY